MGVVNITFKQLRCKKDRKLQHYCKFDHAISVMGGDNVILIGIRAALPQLI